MNHSIIGRVVDTYEITGILGKGGMGVVYQARDTTLDRIVALKMMDAGFTRDEEFLKRFRSEAKALAKLQNPNIVSVFALRDTEIGLCLVMEYVDGGTLADRIKKDGALNANAAVSLFRQLATALGHAHRVGVIHRDIKPHNVMITSAGEAKLTDFGLAKIQQASAATMTMGTGGTLFYMSPEQIKGLANVDARGDIYSLGMTLYEAAVGRVPFGNNLTDFDIRQMIVDGKIPPPERFLPSIPPSLSAVITKAIHKDPGKRYQSAEEFGEALEALQRQLPAELATPRVSFAKKPQPKRKTRVSPVLLAILIVGAVVGGYVGYNALVTSSGTPDEPDAAKRTPATRALPTSTTFSIRTSPAGARVFANDSLLGISPLTNISIVPNAEMRLRIDAAGFIPKETTIVAVSGKNTSFDVALSKRETLEPTTREVELATLELKAVPEARVSVDGGKVETISESGLRLAVQPGRRRLVFEHERYGSKSLPVTLKPGERRSITCYFETKVNVSVTGDAVWGIIVVDGKPTNIQAPKSITLGPGRHRISVERSGFTALEGEQLVETEPTFEPVVRRLSFTLKKQ